MTPNLLMCTCGINSLSNGPRSVCYSRSDRRYAVTTSRCSFACFIFEDALQSLYVWSKPMWKPSFRPEISQSVKHELGCLLNKFTHWSVLRGVVIGCSARWICGLGEAIPS